jgi:hypothetical protein
MGQVPFEEVRPRGKGRRFCGVCGFDAAMGGHPRRSRSFGIGLSRQSSVSHARGEQTMRLGNLTGPRLRLGIG